MLESEIIIAKIQFEVDNSVNALFVEDQEKVRKYLKEKNRKLKEKLKKTERKEVEEVHQLSKLWVLFTNSRPSTPTGFSK